jgi:hypothetical protein
MKQAKNLYSKGMWRIFGDKEQRVMEGWKKMRIDELHNFNS